MTSHRVIHAAKAACAEVAAVMADVRLLFQRQRFGVALRHSTIDGLTILVRADEDVGHDLYFFREYEPYESSAFLAAIRKTDVCIDVGANVGFYTLMMAARAFQVHSFEPVPLNFHLLSTNVLVNRLSNVIANNCAVGEMEGETEFVVADDGAFSSVLDTGRRPVQARIKVPITTLDTYLKTQGIHHVDCIKADVEGGEERVIRGAHNLLSDCRRRPRLIMLELADSMLACYGSSVSTVIALLGSYGYSPFVRDGERCVPLDQCHHNGYYNVLFISRADS